MGRIAVLLILLAPIAGHAQEAVEGTMQAWWGDLASADAEKTYRAIWALVRKPEHRLAGVTEGRVEAIAFSPDGKLLASAGWDGVIVLWDTSTWRMHAELRREG